MDTMTTYTERDVECAHWAASVDELARANETTPEAWMRSEAYTETGYQSDLDDYRQGHLALQVAKLLTSHRAVVLHESIEAAAMSEGETLLSPLVVVSAGHIATSSAYRYAALARRKS